MTTFNFMNVFIAVTLCHAVKGLPVDPTGVVAYMQRSGIRDRYSPHGDSGIAIRFIRPTLARHSR